MVAAISAVETHFEFRNKHRRVVSRTGKSLPEYFVPVSKKFRIKMSLLSSLVLCFLCYNFSLASDTYRAGTIGSTVYADPQRYLPAIQEASKNNVDIVVLPSNDVSAACEAARCESDSYDESVKILSELAKEARLYIVAHLSEKTRCQNGKELIRSNLVFDREGSIVSVYRKPVNNIANCTFTTNDVTTFTTDFGVTFGLLMEEDLVLRAPEALKGLKNFVLSGDMQTTVPLLDANQFSSSWAFVNSANLVTSSAVYAGKSGKNAGPYADLLKSIGKQNPSVAPVSSLPSSSVPVDDLSHYIITPVDLELSVSGYKETVCHGRLCCQFDVKTKAGSKKTNMNYGLAAFSGVRSFGRYHNIGTQSCAVFACAGLYKRSCSIGHESNSTIAFEKISISSNFTTTANYPIILTSEASHNIKKFTFDNNPTKQTTLTIENSDSLLNIVIFGRDFSKDSEKYYVAPKDMVNLNVYDYIFNEDVQEFFDYVWIRLRILMFVVSIYVLEMM